MLTWFLLALAAAIASSLVQASQKLAVFVGRYSKITISFFASIIASLILFFFSYFAIGFPTIDERFWLAVGITSVLNFFALPLMLKAYELGEFSSVYSMILLTPVFLLFTSFIFLGETPSLVGLIGVILTIVGLVVVVRGNHGSHSEVRDFKKGNWLGVTVALLWSVSVNFDKLSATYSDPFFAPAFTLCMMSVGFAVYSLIKHGALIVKIPEPEHPEHRNKLAVPDMVILFLVGLAMAASNAFHNAALLHGLASYTIAIKRIGVLFGVVWGWLFFKEKNIARKALGAAVAVAGVVAILFS